MKTALSLLLAAFTLTSAHAQIFRPGTGQRPGTGDATSHRSGEHRDYGRRDYGGHDHTTVRIGFGGYGYYNPYYGGYGYYSPYRAWPAYGYYEGYGYGYPYYDYGYGTGSYTGNGLVLGALAGGIIGNNSSAFHHSGLRGAAWGAGVGWLLGAVADANRPPVVYRSAPVVAQPAQVTTAQPQAAPAAQPQQVTIINNYYNGSPMSGANTLFGR